MTFLVPFALIGSLLLIIPIVAHLFKPRKMRQTPFSSLRWLKQTHQRLSRRIEWHQWLLFLLRAGCILLLVLALAKPLVGRWGETAPRDRFVIIDAGPSMAYQLRDLPSPLERTTELADGIVKTARSGDRTALIVTGSPPRLLAPLVVDASAYLATLKAVKPGLGASSLSATLPLVRTMLPRTGGREIEIVFLTDNLKPRWQQADLDAFQKDLPGTAHVKIIEVGPGSAHNAWIGNVLFFQFGPNEERWIRAEVGCVGESQLPRTIRLTGIDGLQAEVHEVPLQPGQVTPVDFKIRAGLNLQGQVAQLRLEPADPLPGDDVFFLSLDSAWSQHVLLVEPEEAGQDGRRVGLHLRAGMQALIGSKNQSLNIVTRTAGIVTTGDFQKADIILLAGIPELSDAALEGLENRVRAGAGLAIFLGQQANPAFYNQKLNRRHQPEEGLLPLSLKTTTKGFLAEGKPGALTNLRWTHPLLTPLQDPLLSDLTQARFRLFGELEGRPGTHDTVLARFDDDMPAILDHPFGAGRVLIFNTSANGEWSDLPRRKSFIPLLDRMLVYLAPSSTKHSFSVGEAVNLPLRDVQPGSEVVVVSPGGARIIPRQITMRGQTLLHLDQLAEAGVYRVEAGKNQFPFVVNAARTDSPLSPMDAKALEAWWAPTAVEIQSADAATQSLREQSSNWPLWPALIVLAGCLLIAETIYVHHLCPRANPKAADGVVTQRGVLRPVGEKAGLP